MKKSSRSEQQKAIYTGLKPFGKLVAGFFQVEFRRLLDDGLEKDVEFLIKKKEDFEKACRAHELEIGQKYRDHLDKLRTLKKEGLDFIQDTIDEYDLI